MNKLKINTSQANVIAVSLEFKDRVFSKDKSQKFGSQVLLSLINDICKEAGLKLQELEEIEVDTGPGSFTGVRVGVAVANALAFSLNIPVNGKKMETDINYE